jgi:hypothetical protein
MQQVSATVALSQRNRVDSLVPIENFGATFGTQLDELPIPQPSPRTAAALGSPATTYWKPRTELRVPDTLADVVDFAYVPTPPAFFAYNAVAPTTSLYHLRVEEVARLIGAYRCHRNGWAGRGVRVAMADTGFAPHPFFDDYGFNILRVHTAQTSNPGIDDSGHGTGESANLLVVAPDCTFIGVKHDDYSALALETSLAQQPRVVTNSWGWDIDRQTMAQLQANDPNQYWWASGSPCCCGRRRAAWRSNASPSPMTEMTETN